MIVRGYLAKLVANEAVVRLLRTKVLEILKQVEAIVATVSIEG